MRVDVQPVVSVVIIFWNAEVFLEEAIESVFDQSYPAWELLLVDDGSTDGSTDIAQQFARRHPEKVRYLEHEGHQNRGMSASRNLGILHSAGTYIAFLDADDAWLPDILEDQVAILEAQPEAGMVFGPILYWFGWTGDEEDRRRDDIESLGIEPNTLVQPPKLLALFLEDKATVPSGLLVRREIVDQVGGFEEAFRGEYEDQAFCAKICLEWPVYAAGKCWYKYRQHDQSSVAIGQQTGRTISARQFFLTWLEGYLEKKTADPQVWEALRNELRPYRHPTFYQLSTRLRHYRRAVQTEIHLIMKNRSIQIASRIIPAVVRLRLLAYWRNRKNVPAIGRVGFGGLRRTTPISQDWGFDRGLPVDRYYIENFLTAHNKDIRGCVLEIMDDSYIRRFGGEKVTHGDVLSMESSPKATILGDLTCADHIPSNAYDCVILTQTIHLIYDVRAALRTVYRILKPGGVLLLTVPGISQISRYDADRWGDCWRFTTRSARQLLEELFPAGDVKVSSHGNVLVATALLYGLATSELHQDELDIQDPDYQVLITARAVKPSSNQWGE